MIRLGLIGYPLGHSLSPAMHRAALRACGLEGDYALFPVPPGDVPALRALLEEVRAGAIHGLNVTIPHKRAIADLLESLTPTAAAVGAVNTVYREHGDLVGDNTDVAGFLSALGRFLDAHDRPRGDGRPSLVLGAGGSARAVAYALATSGWRVTVAARRVERARELAGSLTGHDVRAVAYGDLGAEPTRDLLASLALIVNATPVGMAPDADRSPWPDGLPLPADAALFDLVYAPRVTRAVREARAVGMPATTGLEMLVDQALLSFERWTGHAPAGNIMLNAVR